MPWILVSDACADICIRDGGGGGQPPAPRICQIAIFGQIKLIFRQNHLIFGQAMEKIFGQLTSAPLKDTGPVRFMHVCRNNQVVDPKLAQYPLHQFPQKDSAIYDFYMHQGPGNNLTGGAELSWQAKKKKKKGPRIPCRGVVGVLSWLWGAELSWQAKTNKQTNTHTHTQKKRSSPPCRGAVGVLVLKARPVRATWDDFLEIEWDHWDVAISWWLRSLRVCYGVFVPLFYAKVALHGSYGTDLREGVTVALTIWNAQVQWPLGTHLHDEGTFTLRILLYKQRNGADRVVSRVPFRRPPQWITTNAPVLTTHRNYWWPDKKERRARKASCSSHGKPYQNNCSCINIVFGY